MAKAIPSCFWWTPSANLNHAQHAWRICAMRVAAYLRRFPVSLDCSLAQTLVQIPVVRHLDNFFS
jgi:hypothetical protein